MGQTLTKIAFVQENFLNLISFNTSLENEVIVKFLGNNINTFNLYNFTGGKCFKYYNSFKNSIKAQLLDEFGCNTKGTETIFKLEKNKCLPKSLIVSIGTGTSIILKADGFIHLGGTALGGGFFMGFIQLLFNSSNFEDALNLAKKGDRFNIDLKVGDVYESEDSRINPQFRELSAASFGKIKSMYDPKTVKKEDLILSILSLIGENIAVIATQMAEANDVSNIIYSGGFLRNNRPVKDIITAITRYHGKKPIFLKNCESIGAIGALFSTL